MAAHDNIDGKDDNGDDIETSALSEQLLINYLESVRDHDITFRWLMAPLPTSQ